MIPAKVIWRPGQPVLDKDGKPVLDYDLAIPNMLLHYFPTGILGLGLTALLASFMSGMAGNVTAFNTVWTYDIYQSYIRKGASDEHYLRMGRMATVFGIALSIGAAYTATRFNNIMDMLQLVFAFVNAPLFATFLAGHVLEADHGAWRVLRTAFGNGCRSRASWADVAGGIGGRNQGRLDHAAPHLPQRDGAKFLDGDLGLDDVFRGDDSGQPADTAAARKGIGGVGLFADGEAKRGTPALVSAACVFGSGSACVGADAESYFPIGGAR